jgi:hypothetical protein
MSLATIKRIIVLLLIASSGALGLQSSNETKEQSVFQEEKQFDHPIPIPQTALSVLRHDKQVTFCFQKYPELKEIPAPWFEAAEISLARGSSTGLIVKDKNPCLGAADAGRFWVFRRVGQRFELVLSDSGNSLEILDSYRNGYRDIIVNSATAAQFYTDKFKFINGKYRLTKQSVQRAK